MTFLYHAGNHSLGAYKRRNKVDIHNETEILHCHFRHRCALDYAGIVYKNVHTAVVFLYVGNHFLHAFFIRHIAEISFGINPGSLVILGADIHRLLCMSIIYHFRAGIVKCLSNRESYTIHTTCDQSHFPFKGEHIFHYTLML